MLTILSPTHLTSLANFSSLVKPEQDGYHRAIFNHISQWANAWIKATSPTENVAAIVSVASRLWMFKQKTNANYSRWREPTSAVHCVLQLWDVYGSGKKKKKERKKICRNKHCSKMVKVNSICSSGYYQIARMSVLFYALPDYE